MYIDASTCNAPCASSLVHGTYCTSPALGSTSICHFARSQSKRQTNVHHGTAPTGQVQCLMGMGRSSDSIGNEMSPSSFEERGSGCFLSAKTLPVRVSEAIKTRHHQLPLAFFLSSLRESVHVIALTNQSSSLPYTFSSNGRRTDSQIDPECHKSPRKRGCRSSNWRCTWHASCVSVRSCRLGDCRRLASDLPVSVLNRPCVPLSRHSNPSIGAGSSIRHAPPSRGPTGL